jgi:hypothetical protein
MKHQNQNQRCWCSFLSRKLLAVLISVAVLAAMLTGSVTGGNNTASPFMKLKSDVV